MIIAPVLYIKVGPTGVTMEAPIGLWVTAEKTFGQCRVLVLKPDMTRHGTLHCQAVATSHLQGIHALNHVMLYRLFHSKWNQNFENEHYAV